MAITSLPLFGPDPVQLEVKPWVLAYIVMPVFVKLVFCLVGKGIKHYMAASPHQSSVPTEKLQKATLHASKFILYFSSMFFVAPLFFDIVGQFNAEPPEPVSLPFADPSHNVQYLKWVVSIPTGLYVTELVLDMDAWPAPATVLHHVASILGLCLLLGAVPWLTLVDTLLFTGCPIIGWFCLSLNWVSYICFAMYHLSTDISVKIFLAKFVFWYSFITVPAQHILLWTWVLLKSHYYRSWAPFLVIFVIDCVLLTDHVYTIYCVDGMKKKCMREADEVAGKQFKEGTVGETTCSPVLLGSNLPGFAGGRHDKGNIGNTMQPQEHLQKDDGARGVDIV